MALDQNNHQGIHGEGYVYSLACSAGLLAELKSRDFNSADIQVERPDTHKTDDPIPKVDLQVKSWTGRNESGLAWHYSLKRKNYEQLIRRRQVPAYLVVVLVPAEPSQYVETAKEHLLLRESAYWVSLEGDDPLDDDAKSKTVYVPKNQLLTVDTFNVMLEAAAERFRKAS